MCMQIFVTDPSTDWPHTGHRNRPVPVAAFSACGAFSACVRKCADNAPSDALFLSHTGHLKPAAAAARADDAEPAAAAGRVAEPSLLCTFSMCVCRL